MRASARLVIEEHGGRAVARHMRSEPPLTIRATADRFLLVGSAAAPVRGDELMLTIELAAGVTATIGTAAATVVWAGPVDVPSRFTTSIVVGAGAHLRWLPEPTVSVAGSDHIARTHVSLAADATCEIVEEYSLGRWNEPSGTLSTALRVERGGRPLVDHEERFGPDVPGHGSVARIADARHVITSIVVGPPAGPAAVDVDESGRTGVAAARLPIADDAAIVLAAAHDRPAAQASFRACAEHSPGGQSAASARFQRR